MLEFDTPDPLNMMLLADQLNAAGLTSRILYLENVQLPDLGDEHYDAAAAIFAEHPQQVMAAHQKQLEEDANGRTLRDRLATAHTANLKDISDDEKWLEANPTANPALRAMHVQSIRQAKQLNAIMRLLLDWRDGTD